MGQRSFRARGVTRAARPGVGGEQEGSSLALVRGQLLGAGFQCGREHGGVGAAEQVELERARRQAARILGQRAAERRERGRAVTVGGGGFGHA